MDKLQNDSGVFCCDHVFYKIRDIHLVIHDDGWQFLCGNDNIEVDEIHYVGFGHLKDYDPSLKEIEDLKEGYGANRYCKDSKWFNFKLIE